MCAKISSLNTRAYIDAYDVSGMINATNLAVTQETPMITTFSDTGPRRLPSNYDFTGGTAGFFDALDGSMGGTLSYDKMVYDLSGTVDHVLTIVPALTQGEVAYSGLVALDGEPRKFQMGQAVMLDTTFQGSNSLTRGVILRTGTVTGIGNGTGTSQGVTTAGQTYAAVFRVLSGTFTTLTVVVQESQNDGAPDAYAAISGLTATFSVANTAGVSRVSTTAATELWKRVAVTAFTGTSAVLLVTAGVVAGT